MPNGRIDYSISLSATLDFSSHHTNILEVKGHSDGTAHAHQKLIWFVWGWSVGPHAQVNDIRSKSSNCATILVIANQALQTRSKQKNKGPGVEAERGMGGLIILPVVTYSIGS